VLGMPANLAKDAVCLNPKMVLLKARAWACRRGSRGSREALPVPV
jgi:hypothetical protein